MTKDVGRSGNDFGTKKVSQSFYMWISHMERCRRHM